MVSFEDRSENFSSLPTKYQQLNTNMQELRETNAQLKKAKDDAMQSWLDSRPLIDELEKLQKSLADAKSRSTDTAVADLQSQLEAIYMNIKSKKEEEAKARIRINEMTLDSENAREEMEQVKLEIAEEYRVRLKLKQVLRLRRQTLRTLKLTLRAMRLESEAYGASLAVALNQTSSNVQMDSKTVELTLEDYYALTRRAKEEGSLAQWRVAVSIEQRLVAEEARDAALRLLKERDLERKQIDNEIKQDENTVGDTEGGSRRIMVRAQTPFPQSRNKRMAENNRNNESKPLRNAKSENNRKMVSKKKKSIFIQVRAFMEQKMATIFR